MDMIRVNVGCGQTPTKGWRNFDNSVGLRLSKIPLLPAVLLKIGLISEEQSSFIRFARNNSIEYGDVTRGLPSPSGVVDVLYSSHMLEHLDQHEVVLFLREARRVLRAGGTIRLAVPDIRMRALKYIDTKDADAFIASTNMAQPRPKTLSKRIGMLVVGTRQHQWMYDGNSLSRLLLAHGFIYPRILEAGESQISDPQDLNLCERASESVYVEAINP
jgi:predicted SAM-dependent methyltransferase